MKRCSKCNNIKDLSLFYRDKAFKDGYRAQCKTCDNKRRIGSKSVKNYSLKYLYGIDLMQYEAMKQKYGATCAICGIKETELNYSLCVDHDHKTNTVRGLLCKPCNLIVGNSKENKNTLMKAIEYLDSHEKNK